MSFWPGYLQGGYFDAQGNLREEFVLRGKVEPLVKKMGEHQQGAKALTIHQLRRFFQHARAIETRLRARVATWEALRPDFRNLAVAAADAFGKSEKKIPQLFHDFVEHNVNAVRTEKDFLQGFMPHFEALVGFGAQHLKEKERN